MPGPKLRRLSLVLLLLAVILVVVVTWLPRFVEQRLQLLLAAQGIDQYSVSDWHTGLRALDVGLLRLSGRTDSLSYKVLIHDLEAGYHWRNLLQGEIQILSVGKLAIDVRPSATTPTEAEPPGSLAQILQELRAVDLPITQVVVKQLTLSLTLPEIELNIDNPGGEIQIHNTRRAMAGSMRVKAQAGPGKNQPVPPLEAHLDLTPGSIEWLPDIKLKLFSTDGELLNAELDTQLNGEWDKETTLLEHLIVNLELRAPRQPIAQLIASINPVSPPDVVETRLQDAMGSSLLQFQTSARIAVPLAASPDNPLAQPWPVQARTEFEVANAASVWRGLNGLSVRGGIELSGDTRYLTASLPQPLLAHGEMRTAALQLPQETLNLPQLLPFELRVSAAEAASLSLSDTTWTLLAPSITLHTDTGNDGPLELESKLSDLVMDWSGALQAVTSSTLRLRYGRQKIPAIELNSSVRRANGIWQAAPELHIPRWKLNSTTKIQWQPPGILNASGVVEIPELALLWADPVVQKLLPVESSLAAGQAQLNFAVQSPQEDNDNPPLNGSYHFRFTDLSGIVDTTTFSGAHLQGELLQNGSWRSHGAIEFDVDQLSAGVPLQSLSLRMQLPETDHIESANWLLEQASAQVFSGAIRLQDPVQMTIPLTATHMLFRISGVQLSEILQLYEAQGVFGTGVLNGEVPVVLSAAGVTIDDARLLAASPGGTIKLSKELSRSFADSHEQLALTARLLENFDYEQLQVSGKFDPDGQLLVQAQLKGHNPGEMDGRQVNFNLNIEENVYQMLKALSLTDALTESVQKRLEKR